MASQTADAVLFTNNLGQIIFVDQAFLDFMKYAEAAEITGEPLFKALRLDQQVGKNFLEDIRHSGKVQDKAVTTTNRAGEPLHLFIDAVATYDPHGNFLGADIT